MQPRPLDDVRVLDLGQVYNGPYCGMLLAAQGADVIKIEPPGGEIVRRAAISPGGASYSFLMLNAGKRGMALDLKDPRGREIFLRLVEKSDVVLENFRDASVLASLDLAYDVLAARNPRIVLASGRGYRNGSVYEQFGAMDFTVQAISGHMSITGFPDQPPVKAGATLCDMLGSVHLFGAILLALRDRDRTGRGRAVEMPMLDATFPALMAYSSPYLEKGLDVGRTGNRHSVPGSSPYGIYPTSDGHWIAIMCVTDAHWRQFCGAIGDDVLLADETLAKGPQRAARRDEIDERVRTWSRPLTRAAAIELLSAAGIPCAPVRTLGEAVDDPYNEEQGLIRRVSYDGWGEVRVLGSPIQLRDPGSTAADLPPLTPPPKLGEHAHEILTSLLGMDDAEVAALREAGVV
ncbi:CoA transferase [Candidatus Binatia bacterium]|jgi:formyl-CoA transferase|nr:CoA transferase [Candidatus Binatia bacterium]